MKHLFITVIVLLAGFATFAQAVKTPGIKINTFSGKRSEITIGNLAHGLYIVKINIDNKLIIKKIVL